MAPSAGLLLGHLEHMLDARRADRDHHDAVRLELLQQRRRNVIDRAGDDDLVERPLLLPAVVAVRVLGGDRLVFAVAALDERVVDAPGALRQRLDDLDRPHLVGQIGQIGRLIARAGADLEHLVTELYIHGIGHARDRVRTGNRHPIADIEIVPFIGTAEILPGDEFFARRQQVGADIPLVPDVATGEQLLEPVPALPEKGRVLAAVPGHPIDEISLRIRRRRGIPVVRDGNVRLGRLGE